MNYYARFGFPTQQGSRKGAALVIALAFILLLTGLVVAFFSKSVTEKQIANSSVNSSRVTLFANGAIASIIGDLKQEIAAGSSITTLTTGTTNTTLYFPDFNNAQYNQTFVPSRVGTNDLLPNLIKRSAYNQPFFTGTNYTAVSTYIPANRAANLSTTALSFNARIISSPRWNSPLLLPKQNPLGTDQTPNSAAFVAPDWILVARDGSNPKTITDAKGTVVGRYAYNIYDEGGLLDLNVAGYPTVTATTSFSYKNVLSFADLHLIPGISDLPPQRQDAVINAIVGWRNYASAQASGELPNITITSGSSYATTVTTNQSGFLLISGSTIANNHTDRLFTSRQQLKNFLLNGIAADNTERAKLQTAMQYLGTFSRDLNQPSYILNPNRPTICAIGSGGNDAYGQDNTINPNLLSVRTQPPFTRPDGAQAISGEPLIKKRFALNRLAWITYKGPSATRSQSDADIQKLTGTYGISWDYLQQGTAQAIETYFGLKWKVDPSDNQYKWFYNIHNGSSGSGKIRTLSEVALLGREPDFVELLKCGINAGSIAKASTKNSTAASSNGSHPLNYQYSIDTSLDYAIIQIAANTIDQYDVDGYPTRIIFDDGVAHTPTIPKTISGIEDQPYIYRIRTGLMKLRDATASVSGTFITDVSPDPTKAYQSPPAQLSDSGVMLLMAIPEVWNPHDANNPLPSSSLRPTEFRIAAYSGATPATATTGPYASFSVCGVTSQVQKFVLSSGSTYNFGYDATTGYMLGPSSYSHLLVVSNNSFTHNPSGGAADVITGGFKPTAAPINANNAVLTFKVPDSSSSSTFYREPTILVKPSAGTDTRAITLSLGSGGYYSNDYTQIYTASWQCWRNGGFKSAAPNPLRLGSSEPGYNSTTIPDPGTYIGLPIALFPMRWLGTSSTSAISGTFLYTASTASLQNWSDANNPYFSFCIQYKDSSGNWVTCDTKYSSINPDWLQCPLSSSNIGDLISPVQYITGFTDPRTSRFGAPISQHVNNSGYYAHPAAEAYSSDWNTVKNSFRGWIDPTLCTTVTDRPDQTAGFGLSFRNNPAAPDWTAWKDPGWYIYIPTATGIASDQEFLQRGLLSQNHYNCVSDGMKFSGDPNKAVSANDKPQFYTDPDGVLRRAMGAYVQPGANSTAGTTIGLPLARALDYPSANAPSGGTTQAQQFQSRPIILNRPFRSPADLGYVFSGTPWKNLSFFTPESGDSALLDLFCVQESNDSNGLVAGRVNLNTRQIPVLKSILAGAYRDEQDNFPASSKPSGTLTPQGSTEAETIAAAIVARTSSSDKGKGPFLNVSDLVGKWVEKVNIPGNFTPPLVTGNDIDGSRSYSGLSSDLTNILSGLYADNQTKLSMMNIQRFRESTVRALSNVGTARTWNLMIDVIAQTGRYPANASTLANFNVEGERRYWVHLAIDRYTGEITDRKIETVQE